MQNRFGRFCNTIWSQFMELVCPQLRFQKGFAAYNYHIKGRIHLQTWKISFPSYCKITWLKVHTVPEYRAKLFCQVLRKFTENCKYVSYCSTSDSWKLSPFAFVFLSSYICTTENRLAKLYFILNLTPLIHVSSVIQNETKQNNYQSCHFPINTLKFAFLWWWCIHL